ncbi:MAG: hypothetical protein J5858_02940 [Lentisphaeria bacterium]|nr:hypothetical protein [Lentisphaeria bacterium]
MANNNKDAEGCGTVLGILLIAFICIRILMSGFIIPIILIFGCWVCWQLVYNTFINPKK